MAEEVEGVLDASGAFERCRVDGDAKRFRQILPVERLGPLCQLDGTLEQAPVHLVADEAVAEVMQRALRERGLGRAQPIQHQLPAQIDHRPLDIGVGVLQIIALEQDRHREECRRYGHFASAGVAVHGFQLRLERLVEQGVAMLPQQAEELALGGQALKQPLLLTGGLRGGGPAWNRHGRTRARRRHGARRRAWNCATTRRIYARRC